MSLPTKVQELTLDYSNDGGPSLKMAASPSAILIGLDLSSDGSPFYGVTAPYVQGPFPLYFTASQNI